ncbi:hypothetical protein FRZ61_44240 [Hypericibacter adhaerens]|jgi:hypothetical protein|uniref:Uncharacterized protein n=2 Tax=Hypericibacter adhaerens TaxID=2602016 RepID=A0A5J6N6V2_9PROT|nr:hypothetical protein FRZ61_44240 [Hypericibacter adhaerens]
MALLMALSLLTALPAQAGMLGRFEVVEDRTRAADAAERSSVLWSLDTGSGAVSVCTAAKASCKTETGMWPQADPDSKPRYRIAAHGIDGETPMASLWVIDTATGTIQRCQSDLAAEPALVCAKSR